MKHLSTVNKQACCAVLAAVAFVVAGTLHAREDTPKSPSAVGAPGGSTDQGFSNIKGGQSDTGTGMNPAVTGTGGSGSTDSGSNLGKKKSPGSNMPGSSGMKSGAGSGSGSGGTR
ncbi:hypothetical protein SAMN05216420_102132 [Nitrosospira sp. Nl5]|uniref:hypothetical protein n=1 Tax=Nitrosospira sp. Nl5 TaxID=200120 RepID=UPI00088EE294|nr:hypothetical protein [Nitrosospira sp. Nl5]SCY05251.1 hypothetical protein SAMN05216420_102132 [Nitrosospira sp. Nl5]